MPNPNSNPLFGLQKAQHIGPDPSGQANTDMMNWVNSHGGPMQAALPNPESEGSSALSGLVNLLKQYHGPVQEALGERDPMFTPVGGEGMYNVAKGAVRKATDSIGSAYDHLIPKFGGLGR